MLKPIYDVVRKDGCFYALLYWLAVPTLLFVSLLGAGRDDPEGKSYTDYWLDHPEMRRVYRH